MRRLTLFAAVALALAYLALAVVPPGDKIEYVYGRSDLDSEDERELAEAAKEKERKEQKEKERKEQKEKERKLEKARRRSDAKKNDAPAPVVSPEAPAKPRPPTPRRQSTAGSSRGITPTAERMKNNSPAAENPLRPLAATVTVPAPTLTRKPSSRRSSAAGPSAEPSVPVLNAPAPLNIQKKPLVTAVLAAPPVTAIPPIMSRRTTLRRHSSARRPSSAAGVPLPLSAPLTPDDEASARYAANLTRLIEAQSHHYDTLSARCASNVGRQLHIDDFLQYPNIRVDREVGILLTDFMQQLANTGRDDACLLLHFSRDVILTALNDRIDAFLRERRPLAGADAQLAAAVARLRQPHVDALLSAKARMLAEKVIVDLPHDVRMERLIIGDTVPPEFFVRIYIADEHSHERSAYSRIKKVYANMPLLPPGSTPAAIPLPFSSDLGTPAVESASPVPKTPEALPTVQPAVSPASSGGQYYSPPEMASPTPSLTMVPPLTLGSRRMSVHSDTKPPVVAVAPARKPSVLRRTSSDTIPATAGRKASAVAPIPPTKPLQPQRRTTQQIKLPGQWPQEASPPQKPQQKEKQPTPPGREVSSVKQQADTKVEPPQPQEQQKKKEKEEKEKEQKKKEKEQRQKERELKIKEKEQKEKEKKEEDKAQKKQDNEMEKGKQNEKEKGNQKEKEEEKEKEKEKEQQKPEAQEGKPAEEGKGDAVTKINLVMERPVMTTEDHLNYYNTQMQKVVDRRLEEKESRRRRRERRQSKENERLKEEQERATSTTRQELNHAPVPTNDTTKGKKEEQKRATSTTRQEFNHAHGTTKEELQKVVSNVFNNLHRMKQVTVTPEEQKRRDAEAATEAGRKKREEAALKRIESQKKSQAIMKQEENEQQQKKANQTKPGLPNRESRGGLQPPERPRRTSQGGFQPPQQPQVYGQPTEQRRQSVGGFQPQHPQQQQQVQRQVGQPQHQQRTSPIKQQQGFQQQHGQQGHAQQQGQQRPQGRLTASTPQQEYHPHQGQQRPHQRPMPQEFQPQEGYYPQQEYEQGYMQPNQHYTQYEEQYDGQEYLEGEEEYYDDDGDDGQQPYQTQPQYAQYPQPNYRQPSPYRAQNPNPEPYLPQPHQPYPPQNRRPPSPYEAQNHQVRPPMRAPPPTRAHHPRSRSEPNDHYYDNYGEFDEGYDYNYSGEEEEENPENYSEEEERQQRLEQRREPRPVGPAHHPRQQPHHNPHQHHPGPVNTPQPAPVAKGKRPTVGNDGRTSAERKTKPQPPPNMNKPKGLGDRIVAPIHQKPKNPSPAKKQPAEQQTKRTSREREKPKQTVKNPPNRQKRETQKLSRSAPPDASLDPPRHGSDREANAAKKRTRRLS